MLPVVSDCPKTGTVTKHSNNIKARKIGIRSKRIFPSWKSVLPNVCLRNLRSNCIGRELIQALLPLLTRSSSGLRLEPLTYHVFRTKDSGSNKQFATLAER